MHLVSPPPSYYYDLPGMTYSIVEASNFDRIRVVGKKLQDHDYRRRGTEKRSDDSHPGARRPRLDLTVFILVQIRVPVLEERREAKEPEKEVGKDEVEDPSAVVFDEVDQRGTEPPHLHGLPLRLRER